jgi:acyl dehydratase
MSGRFTRPVLPGDSLTVSIWVTDAGSADNSGRNGRALFQTATEDGTVVIDRGVTQFRPS